MKIQKKDRISVSGGRFSGKELLFYALAKVFRRQDLQGTLTVNGKNLN